MLAVAFWTVSVIGGGGAWVSNEPRAGVSEWRSRDYALRHLSRAGQFPHYTEGEVVLLETVPTQVHRILDVGAGDGRLLSLLRLERPHARGVVLDFSPDMLAAAGERFVGDSLIQLVDHDLELPLPDLGNFDVVISSLAIHHLHDERKLSLYLVIYGDIQPTPPGWHLL